MSNAFNPNGSKFSNLKDKVIVLTGGANGIGAATIKRLHTVGAKIIFGDFDEKAGAALVKELNTNIEFLKTDVSKYDDNLALFKLAIQKYGKIDHAVAVAGVGERGDWFGRDLTVEDVEKPDTNITVEVNLLGVLYFVRIALPYLKVGRKEGEDRGIVLVGSAAGFRESPGLPVYQATKHGVQGIIRSLRKPLYEKDRIRINVVCPGMTESNMTDGISQAFYQRGLPVNSPDDIAVSIVGLLTEEKMYGKGIYVEGAKGWELEDGIVETMPQWLGEGPTKRLWEGLAFVSTGEAWSFMKDK